jgi:hypothetical protein
MATSPKSVSVLKVIEVNHGKFTADPDYAKSLKALDHAKLRTVTHGLKEKIAAFANYYVFQRHMRAIKITKGELTEEAEKTLVTRGREALKTYHDISASIAGIGEVMEASGFDKVVDRHIESLCQHLNYNPKVLAALHELKETGITDGEISCISEELSKNKYNLLKYGGANGTFSGFVHKVASLLPALENEQQLMEQHGLPTLQGAGGGGAATGVAVGAAVVAGILCIVTVFYA